MLWLKFIHIGAITIWIAGLFYLSSLLAGHETVQDRQDFARVRMASRFAYMGLVSPAGFVAVGSGTALLFVADALHPWMFAKLAAVTLLVIVHVQFAYVLTHLAVEGAKQPNLRIGLLVGTTAVAALAILALVLAKPAIGDAGLPEWLTRPGFLTASADRAPALPQPRTGH